MMQEATSTKRYFLPLFALAATAILGACGDSTGPQTSHLKIQLTDAPSDEIAMAEVWISHVYLQGGGDDGEAEGEGDGGGRVDLYNDPDNPLYFDLLTLRDGVTADITDFEEIATGQYNGLRFVVDSARVTLIDGLTFEDGEPTAKLFTPSAEQSGIKVNLNGLIDAEEGEETTIVVDFDVDQSFVVQNGQLGVRRVIFTPRLHEKMRTEEEAS